ncbi:MAG: DAK2 domain-containing protein [Firmicutes bacterium]|nr:DAK2 domain-containing protein [Bacillota bacterium]
MLRRFVINGANKLAENKEYVNSLNVFPVPDGDTGTNMTMTAQAAAREAERVNSPNFSQVAQAVANGALKGARGNSGVILSQIYRGVYKAAENRSVITVPELAECLKGGMETAYKAVMKPKEGTILTIIRALAEKAAETVLDTDEEDLTLETIFNDIIAYAAEMLDKTTDMLPQLKQAGVVDAGGRGLLYIIEGGFEKRGIDNMLDTAETPVVKETAPAAAVQADIKFGYCTEFFVNVENGRDDNKNELVRFLEKIGDSIVAVDNEDIIKVHVHTNNPGQVLERALKIGALENIKIENMRLQHTNLISFAEESKPEKYGFVAVSMGDGVAELFKEFGVNRVIKGGNTMNPSTEEILNAIERVNAETVFVLPNNKNIIMAAEQAAGICENKKVIVLKSTSIPKGIGAMVGFINDNSPEENIESMTESMNGVSGGQITFAVKDTVLDDNEIHEGDYLCLADDKLVSVDTELDAALDSLVAKMTEAAEDASYICLYYGEDVSKEDAEAAVERLCEQYPDVEIECRMGGQPLYYYLISVE